MQRPRADAKVTVKAIAGHLTIGAVLGAAAALFLVIGNNAVVGELLAGGSAPHMSVAVFVGGFAIMIAIGAAFTGVIFAAIAED